VNSNWLPQDQVLERLAAAYSLEKMRQALVEFRSSMKGHPYNKRCVDFCWLEIIKNICDSNQLHITLFLIGANL
jgi:hypothetical protein